MRTLVCTAAACLLAAMARGQAPATQEGAPARLALPKINESVRIDTLLTAAPAYNLNRASGGYFFRRDNVKGEPDGTGADPLAVRLREAVGAFMATKAEPKADLVKVGDEVERFIPGSHVDDLWLETKGNTKRAIMLEGKGEDNFPNARTQFENTITELRERGYSVVPDIAQVLVVPKISGAGWSVVKSDGFCVLARDKQPVTWNDQKVWVVFARINEERDLVQITNECK